MLLQEYQLEQMFNDFLDEVYGQVKIGPYEYSVSNALKSTDPIAYRQEYLNWLDSEVTEGNLFELDGEYYDSDPSESEAV